MTAPPSLGRNAADSVESGLPVEGQQVVEVVGEVEQQQWAAAAAIAARPVPRPDVRPSRRQQRQAAAATAAAAKWHQLAEQAGRVFS